MSFSFMLRLEKNYDIQIRAKLDMKYDGQQLRTLSLGLVRIIGASGPGQSSSLEEYHVEVPVSKLC